MGPRGKSSWQSVVEEEIDVVVLVNKIHCLDDASFAALHWQALRKLITKISIPCAILSRKMVKSFQHVYPVPRRTSNASSITRSSVLASWLCCPTLIITNKLGAQNASNFARKSCQFR